jgi:catechol 2,3-dioxygenase-like lactoylglutathione lyase family enzyme
LNLPLDRLDHFLVRAEDLEATKNFYVEVLGLRVGARPPFDFPGYWLYAGKRPQVHLAPSGGEAKSRLDAYLGNREEGGGATGALDHVAFAGHDLAAMRKRIEERGIPYFERTIPELGIRQLFLRDPNGLTIELNFPAPEGPEENA